MPYIVICRLNQIAQTAVLHKAREMVSLLAENQKFHRPALIDQSRHLILGVNDIAQAHGGLIEPGATHVTQLIEFAKGWDRSAPLIIHCWMGISRSPAAALITALTLEPDQDEMELTQRLRTASPYVTPNTKLVEIGDSLLGRDGRLIKAVATMGRGAQCFEGGRICLTLTPDQSQPDIKH